MFRANDGSVFARCEGCNENVPAALISMHNCSLDAKIRAKLEAQTKARKIPFEFYRKKKSTTSYESKPKKLKQAKDEKQSSTCKRPLTAFLIFMTDFFNTFKEENSSVNLMDVGKQGGEKWKSMSKEEKRVYQCQAAELKSAYARSMEEEEEILDDY